MNLKERISAFAELGNRLYLGIENQEDKFESLFVKVESINGWFTRENVIASFRGLQKFLSIEKLENWLSNYSLNETANPKKVGVVMAGNIPLVGFHDALCVLISGNKLVAKLSSKDELLMKFVLHLLIEIEPQFKDFIHLEDGILKNFDAVIATGSDNSSRYFEHYFGKYPHIIRKNRNSIAILNGNESEEELQLLADDIFMYFGLGCRNVSKIFVPQNYDITQIFKYLDKYNDYVNHNKYANNYHYHRTIYLMNQVPHLDNNFCLLKEDTSFASPICTLHYEYYTNIETLIAEIQHNSEKLQCIVSNDTKNWGSFKNRVDFGKTQSPDLWDYADNVDTLKFNYELGIKN